MPPPNTTSRQPLAAVFPKPSAGPTPPAAPTAAPLGPQHLRLQQEGAHWSECLTHQTPRGDTAARGSHRLEPAPLASPAGALHARSLSWDTAAQTGEGPAGRRSAARGPPGHGCTQPLRGCAGGSPSASGPARELSRNDRPTNGRRKSVSCHRPRKRSVLQRDGDGPAVTSLLRRTPLGSIFTATAQNVSRHNVTVSESYGNVTFRN